MVGSSKGIMICGFTLVLTNHYHCDSIIHTLEYIHTLGMACSNPGQLWKGTNPHTWGARSTRQAIRAPRIHVHSYSLTYHVNHLGLIGFSLALHVLGYKL